MDRRSVIGLGLLAGALAASRAAAADIPDVAKPQPDPSETVPLWRGMPPGGRGVHLSPNVFERSKAPELFRDRAAMSIAEPILTVFRPDAPSGAAVLIVPGGAFRRVVVDKEGFETARFLNGSGVTVFVLRYRLPAEGWADGAGVPLQDAQRAMRIIRARAKAFAVDPVRLGVLGFSAGGHVAAMLAARPEAPVYAARDAADRLDARPAFAGLIYPVITMLPPFANAGCRDVLLGADPSQARLEAYSAERAVNARMPPCFLAAAADDDTIAVENTLMMHAALRTAKVPAEMHVFEKGGHGFGIRVAQGYPCAIWPALFVNWMRSTGIVI